MARQWGLLDIGPSTEADRVNLLALEGYGLLGWRPNETPQEDYFVESGAAPGRELRGYRDLNVEETFELFLRRCDPDLATADLSALRRVLRQARDYFAGHHQREVIYLRARGDFETETRYAVVYRGNVPADEDPYGPTWRQRDGAALAPHLALRVERGIWTANPPGTGTATANSAVESYDGRSLGNVDSAGTRAPTTAEAMFVANKRNEANLTDVYVYDNPGVWTTNRMDAALPWNLLPAVPAVGDFIVFGIDATLSDSGPFSSLVLDIGTAIAQVTTITWTYWSTAAGGSWVAISLQDNTNADGAMTGVAFDTAGVKSVHWEQPSDWDPTGNLLAIYGGAAPNITGFWIKAEVTAVGGAPAAPTQQNRDPYTVTWPYTEVQAAAVGGDKSALLRMQLRTQADKEAGDADLPMNRAVIGLRSVSRGADFTAYFNAADEQNPAYLTYGLSGAAAYATDVTTPTGRVIQITNVPAGWSTHWQITIDSAYATQFDGVFHAFLRGWQTSGSTGDITVRLETAIASTWDYDIGKEAIFTAVGAGPPEVLDLGRIVLPPVQIDSTVETYLLVIRVRADGDNAADCIWQELILIPTDEWAVNVWEQGSNLIAYRDPTQTGTADALQVSSLWPKRPVHTPAVRLATGVTRDVYRNNPNGQAILQNDARQRLWFLFMDGSETADWESKHEIAVTAQLWVNQRYASMRGAG